MTAELTRGKFVDKKAIKAVINIFCDVCAHWNGHSFAVNTGLYNLLHLRRLKKTTPQHYHQSVTSKVSWECQFVCKSLWKTWYQQKALQIQKALLRLTDECLNVPVISGKCQTMWLCWHKTY